MIFCENCRRVVGIVSRKLFKYFPRLAITFIVSLQLNVAISQSILDDIENSLSGVVTVAVYKSDPFGRQLGSRGANSISDQAYKKILDLSGTRSSGSGFLVQSRGKSYVITNAHVIEHASDEKGSLFVYSISRDKYEVKVLGGDTFYDIAVLEFVDPPGTELKPLKFRETEARVGERVYAIGNPLGEYPYSVSDGIISAKNRTRGAQFSGKSGFLQTTATIIWGNSGGPLIDEKGLVVGINSQIEFAQYDQEVSVWASQINFALEAPLSKRLMDEIVENQGRVLRSFFGLEVTQELKYNSSEEAYLSKPVITGVIHGSPAYVGLKDKVGYTLEAIDGELCDGVESALFSLEKSKPGQEVVFTISSRGQKEEISVRSVLLQAKQLESIATHAVDKKKGLRLEARNDGVSFVYERETNIREYNSERKFGSATGPMGDQVFSVLLAGLVFDEENQLMYKIEDMKDIGAVIKLSALNGLVDFYALPVNGGQNDVRLYRHYISGDQSVKWKTLYY